MQVLDCLERGFQCRSEPIFKTQKGSLTDPELSKGGPWQRGGRKGGANNGLGMEESSGSRWGKASNQASK